MPGWPIGFGDSDKAEQLLRQALQLNPDGIDSLYFWGDHLYRQKHYAEAKAALQKALQAAPRPGRETADAGTPQRDRHSAGGREQEIRLTGVRCAFITDRR